MAKYKILGTGYIDNETGDNIPNDIKNRHYREVLAWIDDENTPDPEFTQEELDDINFASLLETYKIDMNKELNKPVICTVNDIEYIMDGKDCSAGRLKSAIDLAELLEETTVDIVDYNNEVHKDINLLDALEICKQQAIHFRNAYYKRANDRDILIKSKKVK